MFTRPNPLYFILLTQAAATDGADMLLYQVAREHGAAGVRGLIKYFGKHPLIPFVGPPNPYVGFMYLMKYYRYEHFRAGGHTGARDFFTDGLKGNLVREDNGPASKALADSLRLFVDTYPQYVGLGQGFLSDFKNADDFKNYLIQNPYSAKYSGAVMGWIYQWLALMYGEEGAGRLMGGAGVETTFKNNASWGFLVGDFLGAVLFSGNGSYGAIEGAFSLPMLVTNFREAFGKIKAVDDDLLVRTIQSGRTTILPAGMAGQVGRVGERTELAKNVNTILVLQYGVYKWAKPIMFVGMLIFAVPLILVGNGGRFVAFLTLAFFAAAAAWVVVMIMPGSDPRHEEVFAFFPLLISALGFASLPRFVRLARTQSMSSI
jgi:hypothetical protein